MDKLLIFSIFIFLFTLIGTKYLKKILEYKKIKLNYYTPNNENFIFSLIYHIVYHKGYIDKKYIKILSKKLKLKSLTLMKLKKIVDDYLSSNKYKIPRPLDLTIPITYQLDNSALKNEFQLVKNQIQNRNYSGANKMIYNIIKFQKINNYLYKEIILLMILNQFNLFKMKLKNFIFKYYSRNA